MEALRRIHEAAEAVGRFAGTGVPDAGAVLAMCKGWGVTAELKQHQAEGVSWLIGRYVQGVNVILGNVSSTAWIIWKIFQLNCELAELELVQELQCTGLFDMYIDRYSSIDRSPQAQMLLPRIFGLVWTC